MLCGHQLSRFAQLRAPCQSVTVVAARALVYLGSHTVNNACTLGTSACFLMQNSLPSYLPKADFPSFLTFFLSAAFGCAGTR